MNPAAKFVILLSLSSAFGMPNERQNFSTGNNGGLQEFIPLPEMRKGGGSWSWITKAVTGVLIAVGIVGVAAHGEAALSTVGYALKIVGLCAILGGLMILGIGICYCCVKMRRRSHRRSHRW